MGQIEDLRLFVSVVDEGSIARAAGTLGIAKSAVSRRLAQLENRYDVRLIDRNPRAWEVTEAGQELYQRALSLVAESEDLDADFTHTSHNARGPLRVTIAREFGMTFLRPMLYRFITAHPEIELTVDFDDRTVDLDRENYDLAVRITSEKPEGVSQLQLGSTRHALFASPTYLEANGTPQDPQQLKDHALLHYGGVHRTSWRFRYQGKAVSVDFKPALNSNSGDFLLDAARKNFGIIQLPDFVVANAATDGSLVQVLPDAEFREFGVHLIHSASRRVNKRMRTFIDVLQKGCAACGLDAPLSAARQ